MEITSPTKYKCDGCGKEETFPRDWMRIHPLIVPGMSFASTGGPMGREYCRLCADLMLAALSPPRS